MAASQITKQQAESSIGTTLPTITDIRRMLRNNFVSSIKDKVLEAHVIGSVAKGTNTATSDLDIAVVIAAKSRISALKVTERYHQKFTRDLDVPKHNGLTVDFQFFYPASDELKEYPSIPLYTS